MRASVEMAFIDVNEPLLDQSQVELLRETAEECGPELLQELLDLYLVDNTARVEKIRPAISENKLEEASGLAHSVSGSSANLGANRLAKLCSLLENNINNGLLDNLDAIAQQVEQEFEAAVGVFKETFSIS